MLCYVRQPEQIRLGCGELPVDEIVVNRRSWLAVQPAFAGVDGPEFLQAAEPVDPVTAGPDAFAGEFVGDEPVAEFRVVVVDVDRGVDQVGVVPVPLRDRAFAPGIERLLGETEHPASHRDRNAVSGQIKDQRVHHFGRVSRAK